MHDISQPEFNQRFLILNLWSDITQFVVSEYKYIDSCHAKPYVLDDRLSIHLPVLSPLNHPNEQSRNSH